MKSKSKIRNESLVFIITLLGIVIFVNLLSVKFFSRGDLTRNSLFTLSAASKNLVSNLDDKLLVKAYFTKNLPGRYATLERHVRDLLEEYAGHSKGNMNVEFIDPAGDEEEEKVAQSLGIQKMPNPDIEKDQATVKEGYRGVSFSYGEKTEVLKAVETTVGLEYAMPDAPDYNISPDPVLNSPGSDFGEWTWQINRHSEWRVAAIHYNQTNDQILPPEVHPLIYFPVRPRTCLDIYGAAHPLYLIPLPYCFEI